MDEYRHSELGLASFVTSILTLVLLILVFGITLFLAATSPDGVDEEAAATIILGGTMLACVGALVVAFGLGIAGLWQTERKKLFALLGIVLSGLGLMPNFLFLLAGLAMS
jgi:hypothetical protein